MAMGRKKDLQGDLFVATQDLRTGEGHLFYDKLNQLLGKHRFDLAVEAICRAYYDDGSHGGRPSLPPGTYFRMLFVGYFEGLGSQRGIAWRCADSLALRRFLGIPLTAATPDHSTMTQVRQRLPAAVHEQVMGLILSIAREEKLLRGEKLLVDSTLVKATRPWSRSATSKPARPTRPTSSSWPLLQACVTLRPTSCVTSTKSGQISRAATWTGSRRAIRRRGSPR